MLTKISVKVSTVCKYELKKNKERLHLQYGYEIFIFMAIGTLKMNSPNTTGAVECLNLIG